MTRGKLNVRWAEVIAIAIALVSLYFSWHANQIANEANQIIRQGSLPRMALLASDREFDSIESSRLCNIRMTIFNLGGATTLLTSYDITLFHNGKEALSFKRQ